MNDVQQVLRRLTRHWHGRGLTSRAGSDERSVAEAQDRLGVTFPGPFREYLIVCGRSAPGGSSDQDADGFRFWTLERLKTVEEEYASKSPPEPAPPDGDQLLVFADYLDWSWAYAIDTGTSGGDLGAILAIGGERPVKVAVSFLDFLESYMANDGRLLLWMNDQSSRRIVRE